MLRRLLPLSFLLFLAACANPYADSYVALDPGPLAPAAAAGGKPEVRILPSGSAMAENRAMLRRGFVMIGQSQFSGTNTARSDAQAQGQAVGAQVVLLSQEYESTRRGVTPVEEQIMTPVRRTYIDRDGARRTGYVWARTTVTRYEPTLYTQYTLTATYWVKARPGGLGVAVQEPSDDTRKKNQTNKGAEIFAVVDGSPAFSADLLEGDLITALDGHSIDTAQDFAERQPALSGRRGVSIDLLRDGQKLRKTADIPPAPEPVPTPARSTGSATDPAQ
ncbi:PDZ domain-containing protein [Novispirillum itersonii]|uniref:PDZ domain-containing protein n=1 Tax=Novispirillum itersonii TaxID=189 RepID=A0A7W9ZGI2_NOVIT|nr:PDZ domain-containing protein [Novispirillum itersonii]MBB6211015.1 hypothetical protein [Novispirillum itersonii]